MSQCLRQRGQRSVLTAARLAAAFLRREQRRRVYGQAMCWRSGEQRMSVSQSDLVQLAFNGRGQTADAVFETWPEAPWDDLADTLAEEFHRITL